MPSVALVGAAWLLAWVETGSIDAGDWLLYAVLAGLLLAVVLMAGSAAKPSRLELIAVGALVALAGWNGISIAWSAAPALARDEALLTVLYAIVLLVPLLTLRGSGDRLATVAAVAAGSGTLAVATAFALRFGGDQADRYYSGRLSFPISYPNALAAVFLVGFWPAVVLGARRESGLAARALALGAAVAASAGWLLTQSKGGIAAIAISAVIVLAVSPLRLRLLVPALIAAGLTAAAYGPLTAPFRADGDQALVHAIRRGGSALLVVTAAAVAVGLLYAFADRRLELGQRTRRGLGFAALGVGCAVALAGVAVFFAQVDHPGRWAQEKWRNFKHVPAQETSSTHLLTLGSYRYDIWRVGLDEFAHHPLAGIGSRGFAAAYLQNRHSPDTPVRAHSFELDALSELGIVGFVLLLAGVGLPLVPIVARMRAREPAATAAFAGAAYWIVHASADWIWTVPACGIPFFLLLGAGGSGEGRQLLPGRAAAAGTVAVIAVVIVGFVPPWLSARLTSHAYKADDPASSLRWAKRLDPLSVDPYAAQAALAPSPQAAAEARAAAVRKEPRSVELHYELGLAYLRAGDRARAVQALLEAKRLDPREPQIDEALRRARQAR